MVYKVSVVDKDNLSVIRYITDTDVISDSINRMTEIDAIRDIANNIISKDPNIDYVKATKLAKEIRYGQEKEQVKEPEEHRNLFFDDGPSLEDNNEFYGLSKQKQLTLMPQSKYN